MTKSPDGNKLAIVNPEAAGIEVILLNPLDAKSLSGHKTNSADAEWLMFLPRYGP